jgi:hypothetical protein
MTQRANREISRRELLAAAGIPFFGWIPWLQPRHASMAGIRFRLLRRGEDRRHFVWVHGNEQTARAVLREHIKRTDGRAFLIESSVRNVQLLAGELDPNRMWSRDGAERNLRSLNPGWDFYTLQEALDALDRDRQRFLDKMLPDRGGLLVALHNNGPGYSVNDEVPISDRTSIKAPDRTHEFMLCTDPRDFEVLAQTPHNVVLQKDAPKEDDGSLSRLAAFRRVRYVNIEASHGAAAEQRMMLDAVESLPVQLKV